MELPGHYWLDVSNVGSPGAFLSGFTDRIEEYGTHVRSHPPGFVLLLWFMDAVGLGGSGWAAVPAIVGGGLAVAGVLVAVREVADEDTARRAAPFLVVAPVALYVATTADAFYAAVGVWACTLVVLASGRGGRRADALALGGGLLLGLAGMLSYGLVLLLLLPVVVCVHRRRIRPLAVAAVGGLAVLAVFWSAGFNWLDGLATTRGEYAESVASVRPYGYFLLANVAALAIIIGPATVVGLVRLDDRRLWLLVGSGLAMVALADVSGMSKGEVERIWLPFAFWLLPAGAALWRPTARVSAVRGWLALQAGVAFLVQIGIRTHW
jgi:4-amino-4-deoxy-L-arabinose transferase-like glycosyltransferase